MLGSARTSAHHRALSIPPNASRLRSHPVFENSSKIVIVMEYASKGDLYDYISERQRLSEQEARHFFRQVVSAVYYCHKVSGGSVGSDPTEAHLVVMLSQGWELWDARGCWVFLGIGVNPAPYLKGAVPSGLLRGK